MYMKTIYTLLIEDNPGDVRLIIEQLKDDTTSHYELHSEGLLKTGLDYLARAKVDIILLDHSLPDSQGFDTFSKTIALAPQIPIVMLTGLRLMTLCPAGSKGRCTGLSGLIGNVSGDMLTDYQPLIHSAQACGERRTLPSSLC